MLVTAPASQSDLQALLDEHADLILAIELAASAAAVASLVQQLGQIQRTIAVVWISTFGALTPPSWTDGPSIRQDGRRRQGLQRLADTLIDALQDVSVSVSDPILGFADRAAATSQRQALTVVGARPAPRTARVSPKLQKVIAATDAAVRERIDAAIGLLRNKPPETWQEMTDALAVANQARASAERAAAWAINQAAADAVLGEADRLGGQVVWVAERDACVACLAYSGQLATPGGSFPVGLTYGDKPLLPWPDPKHLPGPPLHPHCRCHLMLWFGHDTAAAAAALPQGVKTAHVSYPAALRREADRSILRGWSLQSESHRARLRAAERLLAKGKALKAPQSVKDYARRAVRRGGWPSRTVPTPPP